ncbi:MAG: S-layer homology domain-containing protein [Clostridia bacterium]|nr:S-layer homology domain-containing protein [Clostridia bacterium]
MKYKTKITALLLCALMCLPLFSVQAAADSRVLQKEIEILTGLGFLKDKAFHAETGQLELTKAQFVAILMGGVSDDLKSHYDQTNSVFTDVLPNSMYAEEIYCASKMNFISGDGGSFYPNQFITLDEAVTILVKALGYRTTAEGKGGYPQGYLSVARALGLLKGVTAQIGEAINLSSAVKLIFNCLDVDVLEARMSGSNIVYETQEGNTFLLRVCEVGHEKGIVSATDVTQFPGGGELGDGYVKIGGTEYLAGSSGAEKYLGYNVDFYYTNPEGEKDEQFILYIRPYENNKILEIKSEDLMGFENQQYSYTDPGSGRTKTVKIGGGMHVIYNGKTIEGNFEQYVPSVGTITLLDNDGGGYDVLFIEDYEEYVVGGLDQASYEVVDQNGNYRVLKLDPTDPTVRCTMQDNQGNPIYFSNIAVGDVLSVAKSQDETYINILVSKKRIDATVTQVSDGDGYVYLDGKPYPYFAQLIKERLQAGNAGTFYLDTDGRVVGFEKKRKNGMHVGYVISAGLNEMDEVLTLRILTSQNSIEIYDATPSVKLNGKKVTDHRNILNTMAETAVNADAAPAQLIGYELNTENKVCTIQLVPPYDPAALEETEGLHYDFTPMSASGKYKSAAQNFAQNVKIDPSTVIFIVPRDKTQTDEYRIEKLGYLKNDTSYTISAYSTSYTQPYSEYLIIHLSDGGEAIGHRSELFVVENVGFALNSDDEETYSLTGMQAGKVTTVLTKNKPVLDSVMPVEPGDILRFNTNSKGELTRVEKTFDESERKMVGSNPSKTTYDDLNRNIYGEVYSNVKGLVRLTTKNIAETINSNDPVQKLKKTDMEFVYAGQYPQIYRFDSETKKVSKGTANDICDYLHFYDGCSKLFVFTLFGDPHTLVIYE